jgi:hypothetical protein
MQRGADVSAAELIAQLEREEEEYRKVVPLLRTNGHDPEAFTLTRLDTVSPERIDWIWEGYLARGKLALLGGDPEMGKSMITIDIATRLSKGDRWPPHKSRAPIGSTIFICSEDAVRDTVRPRAEAAGADLTKLSVFKSAVIKNGKHKTFSLQEDLNLLESAIKLTGDVQLITIDAVTSYMGAIDSHKTADVRSVLEPLADFAETNRVAILGVTHPPKAAQGNCLRSFAGSFAFVAAPRLAHFVTADPDNPQRKLLLPVKNNIGRKALGVGYSICAKIISDNIEAAAIVWDDSPVDVTADQAIAANAAAARGEGSLAEAKAFLRDLLANGPVSAKDGEEAAKANNISTITLRRAKKALQVESKRDEFVGGWTWKLPR